MFEYCRSKKKKKNLQCIDRLRCKAKQVLLIVQIYAQNFSSGTNSRFSLLYQLMWQKEITIKISFKTYLQNFYIYIYILDGKPRRQDENVAHSSQACSQPGSVSLYCNSGFTVYLQNMYLISGARLQLRFDLL